MDTTGAGAQLLQQPGHRLPLAVPLRRTVTTPAGDTLHPGDQRDPQGDPLGLRRARGQPADLGAGPAPGPGRHGPAGMRPAPRRLPALRPYPGAARGARRTAGRAGRQPLAGAMGAAGAQHRANPGPALPARTGHDLRRMAPTPALPRGHRGAGSRQGIQQIAFDLGYSSPSAFISMFRRLAGTTPEQYRLASRAQDMPML